MDIKGKEYMLVNDRVKLFRKAKPYGDIKTEIIRFEDGLVVIKADIFDEDGKHLATGTAYEKENSSFINKTSYIENCETSAVGRALGFLGIGIDTSIASAEEVQNAIEQQENMGNTNETINETQLKTLQGLIKQIKNNAKEYYDFLLERFEIQDLKDLKSIYYPEVLLEIKEKMGEN